MKKTTTPTTSGQQPQKRKAEDVILDPDTKQIIEDAKKPKIDLNSDLKFKCLKSIVEMHSKIVDVLDDNGATGKMQTDTEGKTISHADELLSNITVGNHITSIIFTLHNTHRQKAKKKQGEEDTNMVKKTKTTSYKVHYKGQDFPLDTKALNDTWVATTKGNGLEYKNFTDQDSGNWYGTMGPYLDMFAAYSLRTNELRLGHSKMPITKENGIHKSFLVSTYGLSGAHHVLLEGASFPPERRSSIVQSLGPITVWICMLRSEGIYRKKYARAVKRAMSHIPCIDDIKNITKTVKQASEVAMITTLIAEILLVTTARQATRMFFPITIFAAVWKKEADPRAFSDCFNTTNAGGFYTYKQAHGLNNFTVCGQMEVEKASQIVYHSIFGTFREDLSILSQITGVSNWYTREQLGGCFRQQGTSSDLTKIDLPEMKRYAKMSCANQTGLLSGVYNQVATIPCFSGKRTQTFDSAFFEHIEKRRAVGVSGKTVAQIVNILTTTLEELHEKLRKDNGKLCMGTTSWRDMKTLTISGHGNEETIVLEGKGKMFLGKH